jgi:NADPH:quinone reductase-like Zn-dependent oxidoreductase
VREITYCILDAPLPLEGYVATMRLKPVTDGNRTFWQWRSKFTCPPQDEIRLSRMVGEDIYVAGFEAIRSLVERAPGSPRRAVRMAPPWHSAGAIDCGAITVPRFGGVEVLTWSRMSVPPPGPSEVRIRQTAIGVNFIDVYCRRGYFDILGPSRIPGLEAAGVIETVGAGIHGHAPGDRVAYACLPPGAYAEWRTMRPDLLVRLPSFLTDKMAAAVLLKGMTAEFLLHRVASVSPGDTILVHAAAGGVGQLLCQWASRAGATVIGTVGSEEKMAAASAAGCAHPILYTRENFVERVKEITTGRGVDVAYDAVGRDTLQRSFEALAVNGHLVSYGQASGAIEPVDIAGMASKSATISRPNFGHFTDTPDKVRRTTDSLFQALQTGVLTPAPPLVVPLKDVQVAHRLLESRSRAGSIILVP